MSPLLLETPPVIRRANGRLVPPPPPTGGGDDDEGGAAPRRFDNVRLAMTFFLGAEVMFFAGLVSAFLVLRMAAPLWPPPLQPRLPVLVTGFNTLVLLASSGAMLAAMRAHRGGDGARLRRRLGLTALLGGLFLAIQGYEWVQLLHYGLTLSSGIYGATFYTLIGFHAAHVLGALMWLGVMLGLAAAGRLPHGPAGGLRACAIYWHFVVALWPVLYVAVYLA